jgi:hypothetical protein
VTLSNHRSACAIADTTPATSTMPTPVDGLESRQGGVGARVRGLLWHAHTGVVGSQVGPNRMLGSPTGVADDDHLLMVAAEWKHPLVQQHLTAW